MPLRRQTPALLLLCCALPFSLSSCLARRRLIPRAAGSTPSLQIAGFKSLLDAIQRQYDAIQDFSATVDMVPALGSAEKNRITEYKDVRAYIRFRQPSNLARPISSASTTPFRISAPPSTWCPLWAAPRRTASPSIKTSAPTSVSESPPTSGSSACFR